MESEVVHRRCLRSSLAVALGLLVGLTGASLLYSSLHPCPADDFGQVQAGHLRRLDGNAEKGRVVFLGSSTFQGLDTGSVTARPLNLGLGGDTVQGLLERLRTYSSPKDASAIVLNIGLNDIVRGVEVDRLPYQQLLSELPVHVPLFVLGLQAVRRAVPDEEERINRAVVEANARLSALCAARRACRYLGNPVDSAVRYEPFLWEPDGLHLSAAGYVRLRAALVQGLAAGGVAP